MADEEFEEEVWAHVRERREGSPSTRRGSRDYSFLSSSPSSSSSARRVPSASNLIPRGNANAEGHRQHSAPVNIPQWSRAYRSNAAIVEENSNPHANDEGNEFGDEEEDDQVPPHEWIAKKLARSQISSFSVCEGAGRTLKGRDQRKVRNAVLTKTGFLE